MITLRGRELRRRGRHPRSAGRDRGARRRDRRRPVRRRARRPRRAARRGGARAALADHGVGRQRRRGAEGRPAAGEAQRGRRLRPPGGRRLLPARAGRSASRQASRRRRASCGSSGTCRPSAGPPPRPRSIATLARRCPEALPTRYGDIEPLQQRYDPDQPDAFARVHRGHATPGRSGSSSRPSFGGHAHPPENGPGQLGLDFDWRVLEADPRWREAVAGLFAAPAGALGALYAECWVEPGWHRVAQQPPLDHRRAARPATPRSAAAASPGCPPSRRG